MVSIPTLVRRSNRVTNFNKRIFYINTRNLDNLTSYCTLEHVLHRFNLVYS